MSSAAGLQIDWHIDPGDLHQPHAAGADRRLHRHRAYQLRAGLQFVIGYPARRDLVGRGDQRIELSCDLFFVEARSGYVEIEPAAPVRHLTAGHGARHHRAEEMQTGMHAHQPVAALPIELGCELRAWRRQRRARGRDVDDLVEAFALYRVDNRDCLAGGEAQRSLIAGLAAAGRVEHRAVEPDALLVGSDNARRARARIRIIAENQFGHPPAPLSHGGVGRFFSFRNAGLNSFD